MFQGVGIICFSASYLIAFALELFRSRMRKDRFRWLILLATLSGCLAHSAYLGNNFLFQNTRIVSGMQGWFLLSAWGLVLVYLYFLVFYSNKQFGLFLFPLIFLLTVGGILVGDARFSEAATGRMIRGIHGISLATATLLVLIGFITGGMFFMQRSRLKRKSLTNGNSFFPNVGLPSLEWLQTVNRRSVKLATVFLGIGVVNGYYLNFFILRMNSDLAVYCDAMILGTTLLFVFMAVVLISLSLSNRLQDGRKIACLTILCFLFLATILLIGVFSRRTHWEKNVLETSARTSLVSPEFEPDFSSAPNLR